MLGTIGDKSLMRMLYMCHKYYEGTRIKQNTTIHAVVSSMLWLIENRNVKLRGGMYKNQRCILGSEA